MVTTFLKFTVFVLFICRYKHNIATIHFKVLTKKFQQLFDSKYFCVISKQKKSRGSFDYRINSNKIKYRVGKKIKKKILHQNKNKKTITHWSQTASHYFHLQTPDTSKASPNSTHLQKPVSFHYLRQKRTDLKPHSKSENFNLPTLGNAEKEMGRG